MQSEPRTMLQRYLLEPRALIARTLFLVFVTTLLNVLFSILLPNTLQSASAGCVPASQFTLTASGTTVTVATGGNPWTSCVARPGYTSVFYSTSATGPWTNQVGSTVGVYPNNMTWVKTGLTPGVTYYFAVDAKDRVGNAGANSLYNTWPTNPREPAVKSITVPTVSASISYANGSGSGTAPTTPTSTNTGSTFTTPINTYTRSGHSFAGWSDGTNTYAAGATYPRTGIVTGNVTLTATWLADTNYSISYVAGNGSGSAPTTPTSVLANATFTTPANTFTRTGYTFAGWSDGTNTYAVNDTYPRTGSVTGHVTLTATWLGSVGSAALATDTWAWSAQPDLGNHNWHALASSADGSRLYAASESCGSNPCDLGVVDVGGIWVSTDYGMTWSAIANTSGRKWFSMATNANGTKVAAVDRGGSIWTSVDSGSTWTERAAAGTRNWDSIASSSDGDNLVAVSPDGFIFTSSDSGETWSNRTPANVTGFTGVSSSNDGSRLAVTTWSSGLYTSSNYGVDWTLRSLPVIDSGQPTHLQMVSMNGDGSRLVTGSRANNNNGGRVFTSADYGATWTVAASLGFDYIGFASSGDGSRISASIFGQAAVSTSSDYGVTWKVQTTGTNGVIPIATNIDGSLLFVGGYGGHLWTGKLPRAQVVAIATSAISAVVPAQESTPAAALAFTETTNTAAVRITPMANPTTVESTPFVLESASIFDISVTNITGEVEICVDGGPTIRLWHFTNNAWVDVTTRQTETQTCGLTSSFSPFASALPLISQAQNSAPSTAPSTAASTAAAAAEAAKKAKEQKELTELLAVIPSIAGLALNLGDLTNSLLKQKCTKGKKIKYVNKGAKCPKGFKRK